MGTSGQVDMKNWTSDGHLSELGLEVLAADEAARDDLRAMEAHLAACPGCRAREHEWRELFSSIAALREVEPSTGFDARVLARVRPVGARARAIGWRAIARRLRPAVIGAAATWAAAVAGGAMWLFSRVDVSAGVLLARAAAGARDGLLAATIEVGAFLHMTGLIDSWKHLAAMVPGPGVAAAAALMTALSCLAIWMLYRVTGYQPVRIQAHA